MIKNLYLALFALIATFHVFCADPRPKAGIYLLKNDGNHIAYKYILPNTHSNIDRYSIDCSFRALEVHKKKSEQSDSDKNKTLYTYTMYLYKESWSTTLNERWEKNPYGSHGYTLFTTHLTQVQEYFDLIDNAYKQRQLANLNLSGVLYPPKNAVYLLKNSDNHIVYQGIDYFSRGHRYNTLCSYVRVLYILECHKVKKWKQIDSDTMKAYWAYEAHYYAHYWHQNIISKEWTLYERRRINTYNGEQAQKYFEDIENAYKQGQHD